LRLQRDPLQPPVHLRDIGGCEADAGEPLAARAYHVANAIGRNAELARCHQFQRHVIERERYALGAVAAVVPGRRAAEQRLVAGGALADVPYEDDDVVEANDHGNSPRVFLAARTLSTPMAIAAVRCGILSASARARICSKARSRIWYSRRVTSS